MFAVCKITCRGQMTLAEIEYIADSWQDRCEKLTTIVDMQTSIAKVGMDLTSVMQIIVKHCLVLVQCDGLPRNLRCG